MDPNAEVRFTRMYEEYHADGLGGETSEPIDTVVVRREEDRKVFDAMARLKPAEEGGWA